MEHRHVGISFFLFFFVVVVVSSFFHVNPSRESWALQCDCVVRDRLGYIGHLFIIE